MRLIDADALKKAIKDNGYSHYFEIFDIIDNAPTVSEITKEKLSIAYDQGYKDGKDNWLQEEPKGEWARHDEWVGGEYVGGFYHVNCPCIDLETAFYSKWRTNFCPNCGLPMRKGGAE